MKPFLYFLLLGLLTTPLLGQAHIVKQRARELNEQNNARQGISPAPPTAPQRPGAPTAPVPPQSAVPQPVVASPEILRQHDIKTLHAMIGETLTGAAASAEQMEKLAQLLRTASRGSAKASPKLTEQLSRNLAGALGQAKLTPANQALMAEDLVTILNGSDQTPAQMQGRITSVQATLQRGGVERKAAVSVATDLKSIAGELQKPASR
jgi:hypothetical protein